MKVFWKVPQQLLQMEAESALELNLIGELLHGGPLAHATWLKVPEDQLPFARARGDGITTFMGGAQVVIGLLWPVAADESPCSKISQAQQATGQAVHQLLRLLARQMQADLAQAAAGVTPV